MIPDQITIGGVTITRQQWEIINQHGTWEAFVAAYAPKPEHWDGEPCELPVFAPDRERAKGYRHEYTGKQVAMGNTPCWYAYPPGDCIIWGTPSDPRWELRAVRIEPEHVKGEKCELPIIRGKLLDGEELVYTGECRVITYEEPPAWHDARPSKHGAFFGWSFPEPRWTLTAVPKQPAPRYDEGKWVVPPSGKPVQISKATWGSDRSANPIATYECGDHIWGESDLRPAVREDFMKNYDGMWWWLQDNIAHYRHTDGNGGHIALFEAQVRVYRAAGVLPMPKEFWT